MPLCYVSMLAGTTMWLAQMFVQVFDTTAIRNDVEDPFIN